MLGNVIKFKLRFDHCIKYGIDFTPINKIKMFYFFADKEEGYKFFYAISCPLRIAFCCDNAEIGNIELQLKEANCNRKFNNVLMVGKNFKCFYKGMIGIECTEDPVDISRVALNYYNHIYIPPKEYCSCDPIPEEWIDAIPRKLEGEEKLQKCIKQKTSSGVERLGFENFLPKNILIRKKNVKTNTNYNHDSRRNSSKQKHHGKEHNTSIKKYRKRVQSALINKENRETKKKIDGTYREILRVNREFDLVHMQLNEIQTPSLLSDCMQKRTRSNSKRSYFYVRSGCKRGKSRACKRAQREMDTEESLLREKLQSTILSTSNYGSIPIHNESAFNRPSENTMVTTKKHATSFTNVEIN